MMVYDYYCEYCDKEYETIADLVPYECEHCGSGEIIVTWQARAYD